ncbi:unnamed protein product [Psylliodes chrysocephalus]|uniref:Uncharacterized protein n=1 Tax=Psylliodes chrysocephalus TaxID=3402493 RepID=A0A9P0DAN0_9CUCU|nr:unnamed protein product [Psylliodes chrysocephala]
MERWLIKNTKLNEDPGPSKSTQDHPTNFCNISKESNRKKTTSDVEVAKLSKDTSDSDSNSENKPKKQRIKRESKKRSYIFCNKWLSDEKFKGWLTKSKNKSAKTNNDLASCIVCNHEMLAHKSVILRHSASENHKFNYKQIASNSKISDCLKSTELENNIKNAEIKLCGLLATNNLPFRLMDNLSPLIKNIFPDSQIAKGINLKRSKATSTYCIFFNNYG